MARLDRRVGPVDELSVPPDLLGLAHLSPPYAAGSLKGYVAASTASMGCARASRIKSPGAISAMWLGEPAPIHTRLCASSPRSTNTRSTFGSGNGATAPATNPVARSTSSGLAIRAFFAPAAVEDEGLDDLPELAADGLSRFDRRRGSGRELLDPRLGSHLAEESRHPLDLRGPLHSHGVSLGETFRAASPLSL